MNPALIAEMGLALNAQGIVVENPGDLGARVGLRTGDILLRVNENAIATTSDVEDALREVPRRVSILVQRGSRRVTLRFRL